MKARLRRHTRTVLVAAAIYFGVTSLGLGVGAYWLVQDRAPSITILGSGPRLSVLIVDGDARLLIASGNDGSAFANVLASSLHPTSRRIDVVLLDGNADSRPVAARVRRDHPDALTYVIEGARASQLADLDLQPENFIARATRISLSPQLAITVHPRANGENGWLVEIRRGSTLVVIVSDQRVPLSTEDAPSVLVFTNRFDAVQVTASGSDAVVVPGGDIMFSELEIDAARIGRPRYAVRVGQSESARLTFVDGGIELPGSARTLVETES